MAYLAECLIDFESGLNPRRLDINVCSDCDLAMQFDISPPRGVAAKGASVAAVKSRRPAAGKAEPLADLRNGDNVPAAAVADTSILAKPSTSDVKENNVPTLVLKNFGSKTELDVGTASPGAKVHSLLLCCALNS